ncbi:3D domain-containing protein [Clostridium saccharoperbutylacetonicum]|uniref:3D domain-containing protein n=1 Tax=Clostridium saccharoperbutylacetonicum TaxID=36745 RepID=UPI0039EBDFE9
MIKLNKHITRVYALFAMCLMCTGSSYGSAQTRVAQINKVTMGKYQGDSNIENLDIKENREVVGENIKTLNNAVNEILEEVKNKKSTSIKLQENNNIKGTPIKAELTAYSDDPRSQEQWGSQTAMQTRTRIGVIAAPKNVPLGSKMYIPELNNYKQDGMFNVEDRGGAIKVKKDGTYVIDVWVPSHEEAMKFGRKYTTIYLME